MRNDYDQGPRKQTNPNTELQKKKKNVNHLLTLLHKIVMWGCKIIALQCPSSAGVESSVAVWLKLPHYISWDIPNPEDNDLLIRKVVFFRQFVQSFGVKLLPFWKWSRVLETPFTRVLIHAVFIFFRLNLSIRFCQSFDLWLGFLVHCSIRRKMLSDGFLLPFSCSSFDVLPGNWVMLGWASLR